MAVIRRETTDNDSAPEKIGTRFTVGAPHPEFGVNPNIKNEYGHTNYPKYVPHPTRKEVYRTTTYLGKDQSRTNVIESDFPEMVLVQNEEEEKALLSGQEVKKKGWDKK